VLAERDAVVARLPAVPLTELLIEVDRETGFSTHLTHAGGASPRHSELEHRRNLYAAVLSLACNFGSTRMAELTGISADTIDWTIQWFLREETLRAANTAIVTPTTATPWLGPGVAAPCRPPTAYACPCAVARSPAGRCLATSSTKD
jgi:hypothetical protein